MEHSFTPILKLRKATLVMPSEITLAENMRVRCRGKVIRVVPVERRFGVAVQLEGYEFLPTAETVAQVSASFPRVSGVHAADQSAKNSAVSQSQAPVSMLDSLGQLPNG